MKEPRAEQNRTDDQNDSWADTCHSLVTEWRASVQIIIEPEERMTRLTVLYGHPDNPAEFDRYYHNVHIPLARQMKGLKGWTIGKCVGSGPGETPPYYMIVGLYAESRQAMEAILESAEGKATVADLVNFATGGAKFFYDEEIVLVPLQLP